MLCILLQKESSIPGIYRSYIEIDNSTYIVPFTVAANGTIFITVQTDKLIYSASESVNVNISVKDVAFNATNATLNMTLTDPYANKTYFDVTGSDGNYSTIIPPDNKSVNGTYTILVNGSKEGYRVYSDQTFFIVNERTKLRCDIPRIIQLNTTDTINLFVKTDTNQSVKDAFVMFTGCGFNETRTTGENGLVVIGTSSMNKTGVIDVSIEKGGYGSFIGKMDVVSENEPPIANFTYSPLNPVVNQTIIFNASNSTDPDGYITNYEWGFGDGNITNTTEPIITNSYASAGTYNINLTVTDDDGATNSTNKTITISPPTAIFDTCAPSNPYPSIMGNHTGTIKPNHTVIATKLYTYSCAGTGGHTEYARIWNLTWNATATWEGYAGDWHNISFDKTVVLLANETYNYTIRTGSYPQIIHESPFNATGGEITCTKFTDANGKVYYDWIPAIKLFL